MCNFPAHSRVCSPALGRPAQARLQAFESPDAVIHGRRGIEASADRCWNLRRGASTPGLAVARLKLPIDVPGQLPAIHLSIDPTLDDSDEQRVLQAPFAAGEGTMGACQVIHSL